jgi:hypothetical protein
VKAIQPLAKDVGNMEYKVCVEYRYPSASGIARRWDKSGANGDPSPYRGSRATVHLGLVFAVLSELIIKIIPCNYYL